MADQFQRPTDIIEQQDLFSIREVGVTHPDVSSHVRLRDNGDVEIISGEGLGIILHRKNRSITIVADQINFLTQTEDGLRWNKLDFNHRATSFSEPAFLPLNETDANNLFRGAEDFFPSSTSDPYADTVLGAPNPETGSYT